MVELQSKRYGTANYASPATIKSGVAIYVEDFIGFSLLDTVIGKETSFIYEAERVRAPKNDEAFFAGDALYISLINQQITKTDEGGAFIIGYALEDTAADETHAYLTWDGKTQKFDYLDIGPMTWHDANDSDTYESSAGNVAKWIGKTTNRVLVEATATGPVDTYAGPNNRNAFLFSNTELKSVLHTNLAKSSAYGFLLVANTVADSGAMNNDLLMSLNSSTDFVKIQIKTPTSNFPIDYNMTRSFNTNKGYLQSLPVNDGYNLILAANNGSRIEIRFNGKWYNDSNIAAMPNGNDLYLQFGDITNACSIAITEALTFEQLTLSQIELMEGKAAWRSGLTWKFPEAHPYKYDGRILGFWEWWQPYQLDELQLWYDGLDLSTITETALAVSQWDDKSTNANHASQAVVANQPLLDEAEGSINFSSVGADKFMNFTQVDFIGKDVFIVVRTNDIAARQEIISHSTDINEIAFTATNKAEAVATPPLYANALISTTSLATGTNIIGVYYTESKGELSINGTVEIEEEGLEVQRFFGQLGLLQGASNPLDGSILEIVVTDTLNNADRERVEGLLAWKRGLVDKLPVDHRYKTRAPIVGEQDDITVTYAGGPVTFNMAPVTYNP